MPASPYPTPIRRSTGVKTGASGTGRVPMQEFSMVTLSTSIDLDDGRTLVAGAEGAIVAIWADGEAYLIEFVAPFHTVLTVPATNLLQGSADA